MLYYNNTHVSEGIDVNKTSKSKECDICNCSSFLNKGFKFQSNVCNRCLDLLIIFVNLSHIIFETLKTQIIVVTCVVKTKLFFID